MNEAENPVQKSKEPANKKKPSKKKSATSKKSDEEQQLTSEKTAPAKKAAKKTKEVKKNTETDTNKKATPKAKSSKRSSAKTGKEEALITEQEKVAASKKKTIEKNKPAKQPSNKVTIKFAIRFYTNPGQMLYITGNHKLLGNKEIEQALPMEYLNEQFWTASLDADTNEIPADGIIYNYVLKNEDGSLVYYWGKDKKITADLTEDTLIIDSWNDAGFVENVFYTEPFKEVFLKNNFTPVSLPKSEKYTHTFKVKAPLLLKGQTLFLIGNASILGDWNNDKVLLLSRETDADYFSVNVDLFEAAFPISYKYGVYDTETKTVFGLEDDGNRKLPYQFSDAKKTIINDGFAILPSDTWKGAGVSIPVFSLKSEKSFGAGEFSDLKLLVDWAKKTGLKLIQILPVNDTTATDSWKDSYPYAAISAFALHPLYLNLSDVAEKSNKHLTETGAELQNELNSPEKVDYEAVMNFKWKIIRQLYPLQKESVFASDAYKDFFEKNKHWLIPYSAFCYYRDKFKTADFNKWEKDKDFDNEAIQPLAEPSSKVYDELAINFFVQYHLHLQLKDAAQYAHKNGIIIKGDIPIGIYRYGADAWQHPDFFHLELQAGAPPDDFAVTGQNWGFPTYNWERMKETGFAWWKQRFEQMAYYFDAFRIDHILGFFRIWSIPLDSVQGIMGHFEPSIPVHRNEFSEKGIWFDHNRYCLPYITENILSELFEQKTDEIKNDFLEQDPFGQYRLKKEFATQRQVQDYFENLEDSDDNRWLKNQLYNLISNVIFFEAENSEATQFHFRFNMEDTISFRDLEAGTKQRLKDLYVDYFFRRQDEFWKKEALDKLPALKKATNMLVCGEDLGLVPSCVPDVMQQLALLSLEIQRMPKNPSKEFSHPADAPYLSVVTPSSHDMSTIRGWWEEDRSRTQRFSNNEIGQWGLAPYFCEPWVNELIIIQHLYSPAMWSIFLLQDLLGIDGELRRVFTDEERINDPSVTNYYWNYRMHLTLEELNKADEFNERLSRLIKESGRS